MSKKNELYRFYGELVDHPKYGRQLKVERYEQEKPTTANGIVGYLSSEKFPGIGKKTAEKSLSYWVKKRLKNHC